MVPDKYQNIFGDYQKHTSFLLEWEFLVALSTMLQQRLPNPKSIISDGNGPHTGPVLGIEPASLRPRGGNGDHGSSDLFIIQLDPYIFLTQNSIKLESGS